MNLSRKISDDIYWIGADDRRIDLFESLIPLERGVSYNSYVIMDEKIAVMDTVDFSVNRQFFDSLDCVLKGRSPDYLIINHMEPDHCAAAMLLFDKYPALTLVGNAAAFKILNQFFPALDIGGRFLTVEDGGSLDLGKHKLNFIFAPMVHWPEVMVTYEESEKVLFSADAFGTFGALDGNVFAHESDFEKKYLDSARRYYSNIVGKYGLQVQKLLKKARELDISTLCPLHGPVWQKDIGFFIEKYNLWSSYEPEDKSVLILYASMYGNTECAVNALALSLAEKGVTGINAYDVSRTHTSYLISEIFRCSHIVIASPTYNGAVHPAMAQLLSTMKELSVQKRKVAILDNGSWAPMAGKKIEKAIAEMKEMSIINPMVSIKSALNDDSRALLEELAENIAQSLLGR